MLYVTRRLVKAKTGKIYFGKRTLQIGHQTFALANISRVQALEVEWRSGSISGNRVVRLLLFLAGALILLPILLSFLGSSGASGTFVVLGLLIAVGAVAYHLFARQRRFVLAIETNGGQSTAIASKDRSAIFQLEKNVVDAIEDPPTQPHVVNIQNLSIAEKVEGGVYQQSGPGTINVT
jgi:hypothetical protein